MLFKTKTAFLGLKTKTMVSRPCDWFVCIEKKYISKKIQPLTYLASKIDFDSNTKLFKTKTAFQDHGLETTRLVCVRRDEQEYETQLRRQKDELAELSAERQRLLSMQQHLLKLQESLSAATSAATQVSRSLLGGSKLVQVVF